MEYTLILNGESQPVLFKLLENGSEIHVPDDPRNSDYQKIKEHYEALPGNEKPFEFNFQ